MAIAEITVDELADYIENGAPVIDVRELDEYQSGHIPGAVHVQLGAVPDNVDAFRGGQPTYVICRSGARSMRACEYLVEQGVHVVNVGGGTLAWMSSGRDTVTGDAPS